jgi:hypothetical protein
MTKDSQPILRAARAGDYETFYGEPLRFTIHAEVAEIGGVPTGIGGIAYIDGTPILFSRMTDALRPHKRFILRAARRAGQMARAARAVAVANPNEPLSCKLLERLGLSWAGTAPEGEVFAWRTQ